MLLIKWGVLLSTLKNGMRIVELNPYNQKGREIALFLFSKMLVSTYYE